MNKYLLFFVVLVFTCCKDDKTQTLTENNQNEKKDYITKEIVSKIKYDDYLLDQQATIIADNWASYQIISTAIGSIKNLNFDFFTKNDEHFKSTFKELKTTVPEEFNSKPIRARLLVLETQVFRLKDELVFRPKLLKSDAKYLKEVFEAFSNLNLLINKKLEKEAQVIIKPE